jgi:hypothetical protein
LEAKWEFYGARSGSKTTRTCGKSFGLRTIMVAIAGIRLKAGDGGEERPPAALLPWLPSSLSFLPCEEGLAS